MGWIRKDVGEEDLSTLKGARSRRAITLPWIVFILECIVLGYLYWGNPLQEWIRREFWIPIAIGAFFMTSILFTGILQFVFTSDRREFGDCDWSNTAGRKIVGYIPPKIDDETGKRIHGWMVVERSGGNSNLPQIFKGSNFDVIPYIMGITHDSNGNRKLMAKGQLFPNNLIPHWIRRYFYTKIYNKEGEVVNKIINMDGFNFRRSKVRIAFEPDLWGGAEIEECRCPKCDAKLEQVVHPDTKNYTDALAMTEYYENLIDKYGAELQRFEPFKKEEPSYKLYEKPPEPDIMVK